VIGPRIKEERERLHLTQAKLAAACGIGRRTLVDWEKGKSSPTAVQLSALLEMGFNIVYILTGETKVAEEGAGYEAGEFPEKLKSFFLWLRDYLKNADEEELTWFHRQAAKCFPDYAEYLGAQTVLSRYGLQYSPDDLDYPGAEEVEKRRKEKK